MATPYVVPSLPLTKSKNCENFSPIPSNKNYSNQAKTCGRTCGFSCNAWCSICSSQTKNGGYRNGSEFVTCQLDSPVKTPCNINSSSRRSPSPKAPLNVHRNCGDTADSVDFPRFKDTNRASSVTGNCVKATPWIAVSNGVQEKYLREVEALRGKLRELRGSTPRKLPTPPTLSKLKTSHIKGPANNCSPGTFLNIDSSWTVEPLSNLDDNISDSKRTRFPTDPEFTISVANEASVKRLRELSPSHFYKSLGSKEDTSARSRRLSPGSSSPPKNSIKMGTTCVERDGGDYYTVKIGRNNEVSCSMVLPNSENGKLSSPSLKPTVTEKTFEVKTVGKSSAQNVGSAWHRDASSVAGSLSTCNLIETQPNSNQNASKGAIKREPSPQNNNLVNDCSAEPVAQPTLPTESSHESLLEGTNYLRPSLFSNVPPYVRFSAHNEKVEHELPKAIHKALKWKLSTITPLVVKHTVTNSGFRLVKRTGEWSGIWGRHMKSVCFKTLYDYQKINHLPGTFQIGRKDRLWKNIYKLMAKFGKKEFGFLPRTYILPQDAKLLRQAWDKNSKSKWIVKPPAAARGTGIKVINKWAQVPKKTPVIVQKYISNPYLINGNKFDLRLYVLVTSFHPLKVYLYTNGLVRFASVKYSDEISTLANRYMHLTNYSINKLSNNYASNEDADACVGHKWTIRSLWSYLEGSVNVESLWNSLVDLVVKTMLSGEASIVNLTNANLNSRYSAYELFGVDVLLDESLKPWLLEVNISPSLHSTSPLDIAVKGPMVRDILNIAGYHIPDRFNDMSKEELSKKLGVEGPLCYDSRMYVPELSPKERNKQAFFCDIADRESYLDSILDELTPDDVRHLIVYEDEITQIGSFQKVFPTTETHEYFQYFEESRYYNMLFDAWETRYHTNREEGIQLLESKCLENVHLDITEVEPQQFAYCPSDAASIKGEEAVDGDDDTGSVTSAGNRRNLKLTPTRYSTSARNSLNLRITKKLQMQKLSRRRKIP